MPCSLLPFFALCFSQNYISEVKQGRSDHINNSALTALSYGMETFTNLVTLLNSTIDNEVSSRIWQRCRIPHFPVGLGGVGSYLLPTTNTSSFALT